MDSQTARLNLKGATLGEGNQVKDYLPHDPIYATSRRRWYEQEGWRADRGGHGLRVRGGFNHTGKLDMG